MVRYVSTDICRRWGLGICQIRAVITIGVELLTVHLNFLDHARLPLWQPDVVKDANSIVGSLNPLPRRVTFKQTKMGRSVIGEIRAKRDHNRNEPFTVGRGPFFIRIRVRFVSRMCMYLSKEPQSLSRRPGG